MMDKSVDVIIPVYRPDDRLGKLLTRLLVQTCPVGNIFIMNTEERYWDPETQKLSDKIIVEHIKKKDFDHGRTRHLAIQKSDADVVICMTQDAVPCNNRLIEKLLAAMEPENVRAAYARQLPAADCGLIERYTRSFNYPSESSVKTREDLEELGIMTYFCSNVCAAYDRRTYMKLGGFERKTIFNEDMIFAAGLIGAGYAIAYAADARVIHSHNDSGIRQLRRNFDLAVSQADHPEIFADVPSEGRGMRMVLQTVRFLLKKNPVLIPKLIWISGMKYCGYFLGKRYRRLPDSLVRRLTSNVSYWEQ